MLWVVRMSVTLSATVWNVDELMIVAELKTPTQLCFVIFYLFKTLCA